MKPVSRDKDRRARDALLAGQRYVGQGCRHIVVDIDLSKCFDRGDRDILIDRLSRRAKDTGMIRLSVPA